MTQYRIKPAPELQFDDGYCYASVESGMVKLTVYGQWWRLTASEALALREWLDGVLEAEPQDGQHE